MKTCLSCLFWTRENCTKRKSGFPDVGEACRVFILEPGVDELYWGEDDA